MPRDLDLTLSLDDAASDESLRASVARRLRIDVERISAVEVLRRAIDARGAGAKFQLHVRIFLDHEDRPRRPAAVSPPRLGPLSERGRPVVIVGGGPAGLFCALGLAERGIRAVVLDRGKPVQARRRDIALLNKQGIVDPESNYCFGEGGAGTYSDGKLYTRADKRGPVAEVLRDARRPRCAAGHPGRRAARTSARTGSRRVVTRLRETLVAAGTTVRFESRVVAPSSRAGPDPGRPIGERRGNRGRRGRDRHGSQRARHVRAARRGWRAARAEALRRRRARRASATADRRNPIRQGRRPSVAPGRFLPSRRNGDRPGRLLLLHVSRGMDRAGDDGARRDRRQRHVAVAPRFAIREQRHRRRRSSRQTCRRSATPVSSRGVDFRRRSSIAPGSSAAERRRRPRSASRIFSPGANRRRLPRSSYRPGVRAAPLHVELPHLRRRAAARGARTDSGA